MARPCQAGGQALRAALRCLEGRRHEGLPVVLHVYDAACHPMMQFSNRVLRTFGTGIFHVAVEVCHVEWSYGSSEDGSTGVYDLAPRGNTELPYRDAVPMGRTHLQSLEIEMLLNEMKEQWLGAEYDILSHNCTHFCDELCMRLGVGSIPRWLTTLSSLGGVLRDELLPWRKSPLKRNKTSIALASSLEQKQEFGMIGLVLGTAFDSFKLITTGPAFPEPAAKRARLALAY